MPPVFGQFLYRARLQAILPHLSGDVLDLGCGYAGLADYLGPGQAYCGVDLNPVAIERLAQKYPQHEFKVCNFDLQRLELARSYDTVVMLAILEHLAAPDALIETVRGCLKPGGRLVLTTPTPFGNQIHAIGSRLGLFYLEAALDHKIIYDRAILEQLLHRHGLLILQYRTFLLGGNQVCIASPAPFNGSGGGK
jgi:SAM-dependent methyltransferase